MTNVVLAENFLANVRRAMDRKKMNQQQLAAESGVHYVTINRILNGHNEPSFEICEKLAQALGIDPPRIFAHPAK